MMGTRAHVEKKMKSKCIRSKSISRMELYSTPSILVDIKHTIDLVNAPAQNLKYRFSSIYKVNILSRSTIQTVGSRRIRIVSSVESSFHVSK